MDSAVRTRLSQTDLDQKWEQTEQVLRRAQRALLEATLTHDVDLRFVAAHVAALRVAAVLISVRTDPNARRHAARPTHAWQRLRALAPELSEWADLFTHSARKRSLVEAGISGLVSEREADDLIREAESFLGVVERSVGAPAHLPLDQRLRWA